MLDENERQALKGLLGRGQVVTDPVELITYEIDAGLDRGSPDGLVLPHTAEDAARVVAWATKQNIPVIARGAGTGLSGGVVAERGGIIVAFSRMNRVIELDGHGRSAIVEPGVVNLKLDEQARTEGLYFPPDPASGRSSTIGGNVAENAGGPHCFKYGVTTNYVTGLEVVLAGGRIVRIGGQASDYPEYDLCGLLTSSEGTLGVITKIYVRLVPNPPAVKTLMAVFDSVEQAGAAVSAVIAAGLVPATMEIMDQKITQIIEDYVHTGLPTDAGAVMIIDIDGYQASLDAQMDEITGLLRAHGGGGLHVAGTPEERDKIWYARKSAAGAMARLAPAYYLVDGTVPRSRLAETLAEVNHVCDEYTLRVGYVFHAGDGNLHPLILIDDPTDQQLMGNVLAAGRRIMELCISRDGSITGEHGVGIEKRAYMSLMYSPEELRAMQDVKDVFDPNDLLNPGKVLPEDAKRMPPTPVATSSTLPSSPFAPTSTAEAAAAIRECAAAHQPLQIRGTRQAAGGLPEAALLLSTHRLAGVRQFSPDDLCVTVGAGTPLAEIQEFLRHKNMQIPISSPWPEATIGGLIAANVNGPLRMRYGSIRDLVLALTVVLGDGRVIRAGRPVVKNVAGYDLPKVFVGSYGTLGLITDVTLRLTPLPRGRGTLLIPVENIRDGLLWAEPLLRKALVASAIVLGSSHHSPHSSGSRYLLAYTAEGWPEDVHSELSAVQQHLQARGAPRPVQVDSPCGTDLWRQLVGNAPESALHLRVGVAPKTLGTYLQGQAAVLDSTDFLADLASGQVSVVLSLQRLDEARSHLQRLREAAIGDDGYAVVTSCPSAWSGNVDRWGYRPRALDLMLGLKARWDPAGILNRDAFVIDTA